MGFSLTAISQPILGYQKMIFMGRLSPSRLKLKVFLILTFSVSFSFKCQIFSMGYRRYLTICLTSFSQLVNPFLDF